MACCRPATTFPSTVHPRRDRERPRSSPNRRRGARSGGQDAARALSAARRTRASRRARRLSAPTPAPSAARAVIRSPPASRADGSSASSAIVASPASSSTRSTSGRVGQMSPARVLRRARGTRSGDVDAGHRRLAPSRRARRRRSCGWLDEPRREHCRDQNRDERLGAREGRHRASKSTIASSRRAGTAREDVAKVKPTRQPERRLHVRRRFRGPVADALRRHRRRDAKSGRETVSRAAA